MNHDIATKEIILPVAQIVPVTEAEGPGRRFALWFQGCPLRCRECCNPEMLPFAGGASMHLTDIVRQIRAVRDEHAIEGITLLGGEPFAHAAGAATLAEAAHSLELSVMAFTGYTLEELQKLPDPAVRALLSYTDILIDGPYRRELPETRRRWIGSANQRVHFLTSRCRAADPRWLLPNTLEIRLHGGEVTINGFPARQAVGLWKRTVQMRAVSRFEANLLRVLHALLHQTPLERVLPILQKPLPRPRCLSRAAVDLVQDALAKGCVQFLARRGWMRERFLHAGKITEGRLWQRTPPEELGLTFSEHALEFLVQLVSGTPGKTLVKMEDLTVADRFFFFLAFDALRHTESVGELRKKWLPLQQDGLCRLAFLEELPEGSPRFRIDWQPWLSGLGASVLETLQGLLADRWTQLEQKKQSLSTVARVRKIGATQTRVYGEFLEALEQAQRWDLARCFLEAGRRLLKDQPSARKWIGHLDVRNERLADRLKIYHEALAFLRQMERVQRWHQQAVSVSYFDDVYEASQLWKADWERCGGDELCERARAIVRECEP